MNPTKLQNLILYVLNAIEHEVGSVELAKILYLIDTEKVSLFGDAVTGEEYTRQKKGPLARNFQVALDEMNGFEIKILVKANTGKSGIPKNSHSIGDNPRFTPDLEDADLVAANRVINRVKNLSPIQLEGLAYATDPMRVILEREKNAGKLLIGETVDLGSVIVNSSIAKWRENMKAPQKADPEFEEYLKVQRQETDNIIASLA